MAGHDNQPKKFLLGQVSFLTNKKIKEKSKQILSLLSICDSDRIFTRDKSVRSVGAQELALCSRMRVSMTGQHDRQLKFWGGPVAILARHCPLTDCYFEP